MPILDHGVGGQGGLGFGGTIDATATGSGDRVDVGVARSTISGNRVGTGTGRVGGAVSISSSGSGTTSSLRTRLATISGNSVGGSAARDGYGGGWRRPCGVARRHRRDDRRQPHDSAPRATAADLRGEQQCHEFVVAANTAADQATASRR